MFLNQPFVCHNATALLRFQSTPLLERQVRSINPWTIGMLTVGRDGFSIYEWVSLSKLLRRPYCTSFSLLVIFHPLGSTPGIFRIPGFDLKKEAGCAPRCANQNSNSNCSGGGLFLSPPTRRTPSARTPFQSASGNSLPQPQLGQHTPPPSGITSGEDFTKRG